MSNSRHLSVEQMVEPVEKIKAKWLKKEIKLIDLTGELEKEINNFRQEENYKYFISYIQNVVLLDGNVENSTTVIANVMIALVPILLSVNASVLALNSEKSMAITFAIISLIMSVGLICIAFSIFKKHGGKYAREKSFYEILINIL